MDVLLVLFAVTVGVVAVVVAFLRQPDPLLRARALKRIGASVTAAFTLLAGVFVVGETFTDPGGTGAIVLVLAWVVPLVALAALAWLWPSWATPVFVVLTAALIGVSIWFAVDPEGWREFEDQNGPIRALATFVLGAPIAVLGLKRTAPAGWMLLIVGIVPVAVSSLGSILGFMSLSVVSIVPVVTGVLYLISAWMTRRSATPSPVNPPWRADARRDDV